MLKFLTKLKNRFRKSSALESDIAWFFHYWDNDVKEVFDKEIHARNRTMAVLEFRKAMGQKDYTIISVSPI